MITFQIPPQRHRSPSFRRHFFPPAGCVRVSRLTGVQRLWKGHRKKKNVDFQRMLCLFNLEKEPQSLFSASLMKTVLYMKGFLLGSYQLQDQPQLSSVNDHQLHCPQGLRRTPLSSSGAPAPGCVWGWHSGNCQTTEIFLYTKERFDFFKSHSPLTCLLCAIQDSVSHSFCIGLSVLRICECRWGMKEGRKGLE